MMFFRHGSLRHEGLQIASRTQAKPTSSSHRIPTSATIKSVNRFFERIQEAVFDHYVLQTLSGRPVVEMARKLSKEESGVGQVSFSEQTDGKMEKKVVDWTKLHRMKKDKVPSWTMKLLVDVVSNSGLSTMSGTLTEDVVEGGVELDDNHITSEEAAIANGVGIFYNVIGDKDEPYIERADLHRFMILEEVNLVYHFFEVNDKGQIDLKAFCKWVVKVCKDRQALQHALNDNKTAVDDLDKILIAILIIIMIIIWLLVTDIITSKLLVFFGSQLVVAAFIFGNSCKTTFEAIIFVFVMHPFDVGDRCFIDNQLMLVEEMNILTTVFLKADKEKVYYPNSVLATKSIGNYYRSPDQIDTLEFAIDYRTPLPKIAQLKERIKLYVQQNPQLWHPFHNLVVKEIENVNKIKMVLFFNQPPLPLSRHLHPALPAAATHHLRPSPASRCRQPPKSQFHISTLVLAEHEGGSIKSSSISSVEAARSLSEDNNISVLLGGSGQSLQEAAAHAATCHPLISQVLVADSDKLKYPLAEVWAKLVESAQKKGEYSHILAASGSFGKNMLPRAAALLDVSPITDVTGISGSHQFVRPIYAGNALCTVRYTGKFPCLLTVRSTSFPATSEARSSPAPITQVDLSAFEEEILSKSRYVKQSSQESERPDLGNARIVVTGGRGVKSAENFKMIEKLAEKLGAAVGATRAAVDAGFVPNELQVGQTGKIVAPELYMAFGVSGAIQHIAGMRDSKVIVAVNKDSDAPIFQVADYGLVGDLFEIVPELLEKLPEKQK